MPDAIDLATAASLCRPIICRSHHWRSLYLLPHRLLAEKEPLDMRWLHCELLKYIDASFCTSYEISPCGIPPRWRVKCVRLPQKLRATIASWDVTNDTDNARGTQTATIQCQGTGGFHT